MNRGRIIISLVSILFLLPIENKAQDLAVLFKEARQYEAAFKEREALVKYFEILKYQPNNLVALCKASELYYLLGKRQLSKEKQRDYYFASKNYAQQALKVNAQSADANFVMAVAMGRIALISSGEEKVNAVKEIKTYAEKCVQIDPKNYKAYHVLGKWHYEVSELNSFEKWLIKLSYGALPKASVQEAIRQYEISRKLNPNFMLNYLELARCYKKLGEKQKAIGYLKTMLKLPNSTSDDEKVRADGNKLLKELE